jgi:hypothetical protein
MYEYGTLKPVEVILRKRRGKQAVSRGDEPKQGTLYIYMEMLQPPPSYKYYILIKTFKKEMVTVYISQVYSCFYLSTVFTSH